ncbi:MAG: zinc ribbon domain-containing protein [Chloracidobacterium sp.]|nr:zinc ribbon domain-containing protein [Chloracidobacterium sp.]
MDDKIRCQSCGMPISDDFNNYGTDANGSTVSEYCMFCYTDGGFTNPTQTVDEMVQSSIDFMSKEFKMPVEQATQISNDVIRKLKRWN